MFGSDILEVAIGIIFVYLLVSIICSAVREGIETALKTRSAYLEHGIRELLHDPTGSGLATNLYRHPLIHGLYLSDYDPQMRPRSRWGWVLAKGTGLPSYIPSKNFAVAIMDLAARGPTTDAFSSSGASTPISLESLRQNVANLGNPGVQRAMLTAIDTAEGDLKKVQKNLEAWYDSGMDRVSGWYKRSTQWMVFWIGIAVAVAFNVNTVTIADFLYRNDAQRQVLVARAEAAARDTGFARRVAGQAPAPAAASRAPAVSAPADSSQQPGPDSVAGDSGQAAGLAVARGDSGARASAAPTPADFARPGRPAAVSDYAFAKAALDSLGLPIGWSHVHLSSPGKPATIWTVLTFVLVSLLGWAVTGLAATMGAPFWFDVLNKVMVIRSTVKPREKSPEEGSEDRQPRKSDAQMDVQPQEAAPAAQPAQPLAGAPPGQGGAPAALMPPDPDDIEADVDACDVEFDEETPDEALPMAKGGVG
jgi:hypothetical protein